MVSDEPQSSGPGANRVSRRVSDHLANERTFLAWVRTSLGLIGLGFVLARMGLFLRQLVSLGGAPHFKVVHAGREFLFSGVVFLVVGTTFCAWSAYLYYRTGQAIEEDRYIPALGNALTLVGFVVTGGLVIVALVLWQTLAGE